MVLKRNTIRFGQELVLRNGASTTRACAMLGSAIGGSSTDQVRLAIFDLGQGPSPSCNFRELVSARRPGGRRERRRPARGVRLAIFYREHGSCP
jgi:hypothetical protein